MKKLIIATLMCVALLSTSFSTLFAQTEQQQRIRTSYMLALGKDATSGEVTYWSGQGNLSIAQLIERHRQYYKANPSFQRELITRSYIAAFGRNPSEGEIKHWLPGNQTYTDLVKGHVIYLVSNSAEQTSAINRAYHTVLSRKPTAQELGAGLASGGLSYLFWVGWLQDARHPSGTNSITFGNAPILIGVPVSAGIAAEAKSAAGLAAGGSNMVAAGGGNMVAAGGGNMVAAGGGNMVAAGGGN